MKIRKFSDGDLDIVADFLNKSMVLDNFTSGLLKEKIIDDPDLDKDSTLIALENDSPVGFIMGVARTRETEKMAYIKFLAVDPDHRRRGIGLRLYNEVESKFKKLGATKARLFECYPNYYMPGLDPFYTEAICFFERLGYKKIGDTSNLEADLTEQNFDTSSEEAKKAGSGIKIRRAEKSDYDEMISWTRKNFNAWISEVDRSFANDPISLHIARFKGSIIAFSAYESNNIGTGWFGPMGTSEEARGKGVGGILLKRCLADLKDQGFKKAVIPWVGPIPFYMHYAGSRVKRIFWRYEKILE